MIVSESKRAVLMLLADAWEHSPDMRLGQLVAHLGERGEERFDRSLGYLEDDEMMAVLAHHLTESKARLPAPLFAPPEPVGAE